MGVLSALPIISAGNACCCLWVVSGGVVAAYLLQQNQTGADHAGRRRARRPAGRPRRRADRHGRVAIPIDLMVAPMEQAMLQRFLDMAVRCRPRPGTCSSDSAAAAPRAARIFVLSHIIGLMFWLFVGAMFSTLGGLLGALIFKKQTPARRHRHSTDHRLNARPA